LEIEGTSSTRVNQLSADGAGLPWPRWDPINSTVAVLGVGGRFAEVSGANNQRENSARGLLEGLFQDHRGRYASSEHGGDRNSGAGTRRWPGDWQHGPRLAGTKDSPVAGEVGVKPGARKGSQAFGTGSGKKAHADPPRGCDPDGCSKNKNQRHAARQDTATRRIASVLFRTKEAEPHGKGQSSVRLYGKG
ncbi:hypothetical protein KUCAC02_024787, partial [Chaenocephalus aceratus]